MEVEADGLSQCFEVLVAFGVFLYLLVWDRHRLRHGNMFAERTGRPYWYFSLGGESDVVQGST